MEAKDFVLALKERGFTQIEIGEGTDIPQPTISKIERGDVSDVMSKTYRSLQAFYEKHKDRSVLRNNQSVEAS